MCGSKRPGVGGGFWRPFVEVDRHAHRARPVSGSEVGMREECQCPHRYRRTTMNAKTLIGVAVFAGAIWPSLGLWGTQAASPYTLAGRELAGVRGGAATCWVPAVLPCPVASRVCPTCTAAGNPCPGIYQAQAASSFSWVYPGTNDGWALGRLSWTQLPTVVCITKKDCTTCDQAGPMIVCLTPGTAVPFSQIKPAIPTGTTCYY
jgi:hypothetical protein